MTIQTTYHANGKLLLTGEYLVLHGAKAIALPLQVGQHLRISHQADSDSIHWQATFQNQIWFSCVLSPIDYSVFKSTHSEKAQVISSLFQTLQNLNPEFSIPVGTQFETRLDSDPEWGFGSSSTLVSLLAQWAKVDAFQLNGQVFGGSGFDIACAQADGPIFYVRNEPIHEVELKYPFDDQLFLLYSGQKMKTNPEVSNFLKKEKPSAHLIQEISDLSGEFAQCANQEKFNQLILQHEKLIGNLIGKTPVKQAFFPDFDGELKSLGAWGGDFYLVSSELPFSRVEKYFANKGLTTLLRWNDWILKRNQS